MGTTENSNNDIELKLNLSTNEPENNTEESENKNLTVMSLSNMAIKKDGQTSSDAMKDINKIIFLVYLYFLQGIPLGLCASMPFLLSARGVSYSDQGTFSFAFWPFSIKILWAPLVDSLYINRIGRRKTWLVPVQFLMALFLFTCADRVQNLIDYGKTKSDIIFLTFVFSLFVFLAATQDIAVDGWAISMLSKENVSWQATCNFTGQAIGFFFGNIIFIVFESTKFSNQFIRPLFGLALQDHGIITLKMFMYSFGVIFIVTTFMILFLINENHLKSADFEMSKTDKHLGFFSTYKMIWKIINLKRVQQLAFILLTSRIGWATDSALFLKMIEYGVSKEVICLLTIPLIPVNVLWPLIVTKYTNGPKSLILNAKCIPIKLLVALMCTSFMYFLRDFKNSEGEYDYKFYITCVCVFAINTMVDLTRAVSMTAFIARVSDESIGGTYMTFLTTLANLGGKYPSTLALYMINWFTKKHCSFESLNVLSMSANNSDITYSTRSTILIQNTCSTTYQAKDCREAGGECITTFDAFYYLSIILVFTGLIWLILFKKIFKSLNYSRKSEWKLVK